jgi:hypothetical protein
VNLEKAKWHIDGHPDGACLLKVVISLAYIDTQATSAFIRTELTRMDTKIASLNYDIKKFNAWVKGQVSALAARGETTSDLIVNLFKGYEAVPDRVFKDYIEQKKSNFEEGSAITSDELMQLAQNKFEGRVLAKTWNAPTDEQEQIIALEARIESLQSKNKALNKRGNTGTGPKGKQQPKGARGRNSNNKKGKGGQNDNDYMNALGKWAWLKIPPKQGETKKMFKGKSSSGARIICAGADIQLRNARKYPRRRRRTKQPPHQTLLPTLTTAHLPLLNHSRQSRKKRRKIDGPAGTSLIGSAGHFLHYFLG